ncbi:hypothetical protein C5167_022621 [Papaver somniferum]|uniref:Uncharacterized protein n=1 Tax=Papaver somniferum TaxID=3469 RepID=A0A4Y7JID2_PAPSO|nr:protein PSY1-like [Papaver somniferum]RZC60864.1 hypothetical protein C5167_022621 [Papaver somniferum]
MGRFYFFKILLVSAMILSLFFSQGSARNLVSLGNDDHSTVDVENGRRMLQVNVMDYKEPGANPKNTPVLPPPPPAEV